MLLRDYKRETYSYHKGVGRVFWQFRRDKLHGQVAGVKWFYKYPKFIARQLNKSNWQEFSGHSICRTGATFIADSGASLIDLKRCGQWKSDQVAQRYVEESTRNKLSTANVIESQINGDDEQSIAFEKKGIRKIKRSKRKISFSKKELDESGTSSSEESDYQSDDENPKKKRKLFDGCTFRNCTFTEN